MPTAYYVSTRWCSLVFSVVQDLPVKLIYDFPTSSRNEVINNVLLLGLTLRCTGRATPGTVTHGPLLCPTGRDTEPVIFLYCVPHVRYWLWPFGLPLVPVHDAVLVSIVRPQPGVRPCVT